MKSHHRLGRTGARARVGSGRAHVHRLLVALMQVCAELEKLHPPGPARAACVDVRAELSRWLDRTKRRASRRSSKS